MIRPVDVAVPVGHNVFLANRRDGTSLLEEFVLILARAIPLDQDPRAPRHVRRGVRLKLLEDRLHLLTELRIEVLLVSVSGHLRWSPQANGASRCLSLPLTQSRR